MPKQGEESPGPIHSEPTGFLTVNQISWRVQPCRCLWRGLLQTMKTTPRRRTTLQFSQMRLTLARTFMALGNPSDSWDKPRNIYGTGVSNQGAKASLPPLTRIVATSEAAIRQLGVAPILVHLNRQIPPSPDLGNSTSLVLKLAVIEDFFDILMLFERNPMLPSEMNFTQTRVSSSWILCFPWGVKPTFRKIESRCLPSQHGPG